MATAPLITFKAGRCTFSGRRVTPEPTPGYLYLYSEDDLLHFCWRPRSAPSTEADLDLLMVPGDGTFHPFVKGEGTENVESPTNGRIFVLKFQSSSQKHFFWMQSKSQDRQGNPSLFSERDRRIGQVVDSLLQGEEVDLDTEVQEMRRGSGGGAGGPNGDADAMEVDHENDLTRQGSGGAGQDATGGDPREEGEASREGGADGGRAASSGNKGTNTIVQEFLNSLKGDQGSSSGSQQQADEPFTTLPDLLRTPITIPWIDAASPKQVDSLCQLLPPELFLLVHESSSDPSSSDPNPSPAACQAAMEALSTDQKKFILRHCLRSPQFQQSLASLTVALRDGGLPMIGEALGLKLGNGGMIRGGSLPLGGGAALEAFVEGVKRTVEEEEETGKQ